eukprot:s1667_g6.t1
MVHLNAYLAAKIPGHGWMKFTRIANGPVFTSKSLGKHAASLRRDIAFCAWLSLVSLSACQRLHAQDQAISGSRERFRSPQLHQVATN